MSYSVSTRSATSKHVKEWTKFRSATSRALREYRGRAVFRLQCWEPAASLARARTSSISRCPSRGFMLLDWLGLCLSGWRAHGSTAEHRYDEFEAERATTVHAINEAVDVDYEVGAVLGRGGFGLVKNGVHRKTKARCALKFFQRTKKLSKKDEELVFMEAGILTGLVHAHVVEMRGFYKWDTAYCLVLEHMDGGELCEDIVRRVFYSEACARRIILQVMDALAFLHKRGICHRDVKPENLLLHCRGSEQLADFGLATVLSMPTYKVVEPVGSLGYAAPELLRVLPYDGQADVFSLGVVSFLLLSGYLPFGGAANDVTEVVHDTLCCKPSFDEVQWSAVSEGARGFVKSLLSPNPSERPTAESAMFHPWMKFRGEALLSRSLSDRRSGDVKPLLQEYQTVQRKKLRAAVGAVVAANRLQKFLAAAREYRRDKAAKSHGSQLPEENGATATLPQDEAGTTSQSEENV
eukprot:g6566.t2